MAGGSEGVPKVQSVIGSERGALTQRLHSG